MLDIWVTEPDEVAKRVPQFTEQFEALLKKHPDVAEVLYRAREGWTAYKALGPVQKVMAHIQRGADVQKKPYSLEQAYTDMIDEWRPVWKTVKQAEDILGRRKLDVHEKSRIDGHAVYFFWEAS
jgi:hypothetical protein